MNFKIDLKVALVQMEPKQGPQKNIEIAEELISFVKELGADIVVFPEMFMSYPPFFSSLKDIAQEIDGEFVKTVSYLSRRFEIYTIATLWEKSSVKDKVYNTAFMCDPEGKVLTTYRKLHLFDAFELHESKWMEAGDNLPDVVDVNGVNISITICYDLRFPELYRTLAKRETHLVFILAAWYRGVLKEEHWLTLLKARAIENTFYVAGVGCIGKRFCGRSCVIDPFGVILAEAGEEETVLFFSVSLHRIERVRDKLPSLKHIKLV